MTVISKATAGLSLFSCIRDMHKNAVIYSKNEAAKNASDTFLASTVASDNLSAKDSERKKWFFLNNEAIVGFKEKLGYVSGYLKGLKNTITRYIPNFIVGIYALLAKNSTRANIAALGLAIIEGIDFVKNSTNIFEKKDYLK